MRQTNKGKKIVDLIAKRPSHHFIAYLPACLTMHRPANPVKAKHSKAFHFILIYLKVKFLKISSPKFFPNVPLRQI